MEKRYFVYILLCSDNSFYIGITNNLERRLEEHQSGYSETSYTFSRRPVELVYFEIFNKPMKAIKREKQLKRWSRAKKEALINEEFDKLHELAQCKNESHFKNHDKRKCN